MVVRKIAFGFVVLLLGLAVSWYAPTAMATGQIAAPVSHDEPLIETDATTAAAEGVVISQVVTRIGELAGHELIAFFNNDQSAVDVTGWCVNYYSSSLTKRQFCFTPSTVGMSLVLPAKSYAVLVSNGLILAGPTFVYDGLLATNGLSEERGIVEVLDAAGVIQDAVAWGGASGIEGSTNEPVQRSLTLERRQISLGSYQDTGDSSADFYQTPPTGDYQDGSIIEIVDYCLNIDLIQSVVPDGMDRNELTGECHFVSPEETLNVCDGVVISEVAANYNRQYVEIYNTTHQAVSLDGCIMMTNRSTSARHIIADVTLDADTYKAVYIDQTPLTLTKTTTGSVYLLSSDGLLEVDSVEYSGLAPDTSWSLFADGWKQTYQPSPELENIYQPYLPCEDGYFRNEETGRCRKIEIEPDPIECPAGKELNIETGRCRNLSSTNVVYASCRDGQYRHPETNRCRNIAAQDSELVPCQSGQYRHPETNRCRSLTLAASTLTPCKPGQARNPETNRCRSIVSGSASNLKPCQPGQERNPETNRCRKSEANGGVPEAAFAAIPVADSSDSMAGWWVLGAAGVLAVGYGAWEWRREAYVAITRLKSFFRSSS